MAHGFKTGFVAGLIVNHKSNGCNQHIKQQGISGNGIGLMVILIFLIIVVILKSKGKL